VVILNEIGGNDFSLIGIEILDQAILLFLGGLLTGFLQCNIFKSLTTKYTWWILISALSWGIGWFGLILGGAINGLIAGIAILRLFELPVHESPNNA